jgi:hypothetical protein
MKVSARKRQLDQLASELNATLRSDTENKIHSGKILIKIRKLLAHGNWLDWLKENFDLSERTARNYHDGAEYVERKSKSAPLPISIPYHQPCSTHLRRTNTVRRRKRQS